MDNLEDRSNQLPEQIELAASIETCHRQIHMLGLMVTAMAGMLNDNQRAIMGEVISNSVENYEPLMLKGDLFKQQNHEATSTIALGYETAIATHAAAWKRALPKTPS